MNNSRKEECKPRRGLRQGDSMTSLPFLIVAKGLVGMVRKTIKKNLFHGVKVGRKCVEVALLEFVNDTLIFCEPKYQNTMAIKIILCNFEMIYSLQVP